MHSNEADISIALFTANECNRYGKVTLEPDTSIILGFNEKANKGELANAGSFLLRKKALEKMANPELELSFESDVLPLLSKAGVKITGCAFKCEFIDIGVPEDYFTACNRFKFN